jgi:hypothetical protein
MTMTQHLDALDRHVGPSLLDAVLLNSAPIAPERLRPYAEQQAELVSAAGLSGRREKVLVAPLVSDSGKIRHDPRGCPPCSCGWSPSCPPFAHTPWPSTSSRRFVRSMKLLQRLASIRAVLLKMAVDALLFILAYVVAFELRVEQLTPVHWNTIAVTIVPLLLMKISVYHFMGPHRSIWRYSGLSDLEELLRATLACGVGVVFVGFLLPEGVDMPRSVPFID